MQKLFFKYLFQVILIVGICIYALAEWRFNSININSQVQSIQNIIANIFDDEQIILSEIETPKNSINNLNNHEYYFGIYQNDSLIKWNNPEFIVTENISSIKDGKSVQHLTNGYYLVTKKTDLKSNMVYAVFKPIYTHYNFTNKFLKNEWLIDFPAKSELEIVEQPTQNHIVVKSKTAENYFYVQPIGENDFVKINIYYLLLISVLLIIVLINITQLLNFIHQKYITNWVWFLVAIGLYGLVYILLFKVGLQLNIFKSEIFNPEIYASKYFESLGHLAIFSIIYVWILIFITNKISRKPRISYWAYSLLFIVSILLVRFTIFSLVNDSNISFSVFNRASIGLFSLIGVSIIVVQTAALFFLVRSCFPILKSINFSIAIIIICAITTAFYFNYHLENKEIELRKIIAKKLTDERDIATEFLFKESNEKIQKDNYLKGFLLQDKFRKNECIKYLKQRYFKGYFDKYNIEFYVLRKHWQVADARFKMLDSICSVKNKITDGLFYSENKNAENQYYSKISVLDSNKTLALIFISFNPKSFKKDKIYPSLIVEQKANTNDITEQIDFAVYNNNQLIRQSGNSAFPSELSNQQNLKSDSIVVFYTKYTENLILKSDSGKVIWMINYDKDLYQLLSLFGIILILLGLLCCIAILIMNFKNISLSFFSFRNKVLMAICSITVLILISTAIMFSIFYAEQYNDLLKINLSNKINNVQKDLMLSLENSVNTRLFHSLDENSIDDLVHHLSEVHDVDINLFDANGGLVASSQSLIYENGILNPKINFEVFDLITNQKNSLVFNDEKIGKLNFKSAYLPITNEKNELKYILSVPYFFREKELTDNFNNLIITLVNVYLLLILVAVITAIFISNNLTKSFKIIREKLSELKLGKRNEPIVWLANDEIGSLVAEYNKMIAELENSTSKLAQTERESAWREMARQVAHEIKNPLTPMKLSIQLLERAIKDKRDDVNEMTIKVSKTLIEQIDNLTQIATQFSQFAKISSADFEVFDVNEILKNVVELFSNQNEMVNIKLVTDADEALINADKNQCLSVFNNLVLNAIQSIPEGNNGEIFVHQFVENNQFVITVNDNGCGIEQDKLERIFEPNFTTKSSGTGLGLAIAKTIIENANGKIFVKSKVGEGSEFKLSFPMN